MISSVKIVAGLLFFGSILMGCHQSGNQNNLNHEEEVENSSLVFEDASNVEMPVSEYVKWIQNPDNGFRKIKTIDELEFVVQYKPAEYIVCMEERGKTLEDSVLKRRVTELEGAQYFDLKINLKSGEGELLKHNIASADEYQKRVNYFAFEMQKDIQLVVGNDTLPCELYHFERTYDVAPFCTILLGFDCDKTKINTSKTLLVYDKTFKKGLLKFTFKENNLQNKPKLETL